MLAFYTTASQEEVDFDTYELFEVDCEYTRIENTWDIFSKNAHAIQEDFNILTEDRESQPIPEGVQCVNPDNIFIEEGAHFMPALRAAKHQGSMFTIRTVLPRVEDSDARPTIVNALDDRIITIYSGKIGNSVEAAENVIRLIET